MKHIIYSDVTPARAGMIRAANDGPSLFGGKPRASGDDPDSLKKLPMTVA